MVTFEEHLETIMGLENYQAHNILYFDSYSAIVEYWINSNRNEKEFVDTGDGWIEVE